QVLDLPNLLFGHRLIMGKVEPQIIRGHHRPGLLDVRAQNFFESSVDQMRRGMVTPRRVTLFFIDHRRNYVTHRDGSALDTRLVKYQPRQRGKGVDHFQLSVSVEKHSGVADLAAGLGIERRLTKDHEALFPLAQSVSTSVSLDDRRDL